MLIAKTVDYPHGAVRLLINPNLCEICRRHRADCTDNPWPNHTFLAAIERADNVPGWWLSQPVIDEDDARQHRLIDASTRLHLVTERPTQ